MSLKSLIKNQTIVIDDHRRGCGEQKKWNDRSSDIHIDKRTHYPIRGDKEHEIIIKVPLNSDNEVKVISKDGQTDIPRSIQKEIEKAFRNKEKRDEFVADVIDNIRNYNEAGLSEEDFEKRAKQAITKIAKHFNVEKVFFEYYRQSIAVQYREDRYNNLFFFIMTDDFMKIGQIDSSILKKCMNHFYHPYCLLDCIYEEIRQ